MGNEWQRATPGERVRFSARSHNAMLDVARWYADNGGVGNSSRGRGDHRSHFIKVENTTGEDLNAGAVVALGDPAFDPGDGDQATASFRTEVWLSAEVATKDGDKTLALVVEPIAKDAIGLAAVTGAWPVLLDVKSESDKWADVTDEDPSKLTTGAKGPFRIVWKESGEGEKQGVVAFAVDPVKSFQIRNDTGQDLTAFQIVGLNDLLNTPSESYHDDYDQDGPGTLTYSTDMSGVVPEAPKHNGAFAIVLADIADGETGPACADGLAVCHIDFSSFPTGTFAEIDQEHPSMDTLTAFPEGIGSARILWTDGDWACVRLGNLSPGKKFRGVLNEKLTAGGSARCTVYVREDTIDVTAYDWLLEGSTGSSSIPSGTRIYVATIDGKFYITEAQCTAESGE